MSYLVHQPYDISIAEHKARVRAYRNYLASAQARFPPGAYEFATARWHYDTDDHRCPHDAWVETVLIVEPASGARREVRGLEIRLQLLGAYHDGRLVITYQGVRRYSLFQPFPHELEHAPPVRGHGDWLVDEITASDNGRPELPLVIHEIEFSNQGLWTIEAEEIVTEWKPDIASEGGSGPEGPSTEMP